MTTFWSGKRRITAPASRSVPFARGLSTAAFDANESPVRRTEMNERFEQVNQRFDNVEASLGRRYQEIDELRDRLRLIETRVDRRRISPQQQGRLPVFVDGRQII